MKADVYYSNSRLSPDGYAEYVLLTHMFDGYIDIDDISDFIQEGLNSDSPLLYYQFLGAYEEYDLHYMTVTKYFQNSDGRWIAISTWGERRSLDLEVLVEYIESTLWNFDFAYYEIYEIN